MKYGNFIKEVGLEYKNVEEVSRPTEAPAFVPPPKGVWAVYGNKYMPVEQVTDKLVPGLYHVGYSMSGPYLTLKSTQTDDLVKLPDEPSDKIIDHIKEFWTLGDSFSKLGFLHKRGILLFGPPGGGKTVTVMQLVNFMTQKGSISIDVDTPWALSDAINMVRSIEKDTSVMVILEDIDNIVARCGDVALTSILDGEHNSSNILYLATTNYVSRLPPRLIQRPSRFDVIEYIGFPSKDARKVYLKARLPFMEEDTINEWADKTEEFSIPQLKELIICTLIYKMPLEESLTRIKKLSPKTPGRLVD